MQKFTHFYRLTAVILFLFLLFVQIVSAQVTATLNIIPPYSPYYRDYAGYSNNIAIITLLYAGMATNGNALNVFISGSITKDDGTISIAVSDNYRPNMPITLMPNIPKTITGGQLRDIFGNGTTSDLIVSGITKEDIVQNQALPEGTYNICIKVRDFQSGRLMAQDCRAIFIVHAEPPQIIPYINNEVVDNFPQDVMVNWTPVTPFVQGTKYRLRVAKLLEGVSPVEALDYATQIVLEKSNISTTNFPLGLHSGVKLDTGAVYVMQVTATAPTSYIKNDGKSEPVIFAYKGNEKLTKIYVPGSVFTFLNPRDLNKPDTLKVNPDNPLLINWGWIKEIKKDSSVLDDLTQIKNLNLKKYSLIIKKKSNQSIIFQTSFERNLSDSIKSYLSLPQVDAEKAGFTDGDKYLASIDAIDVSENIYKTFTSNDFVYRKIKSDTAYFDIPIRGVIKYAFKDYPEIYPVKSTEILIDAYKKISQTHSGGINNIDKKVKTGQFTKIATKTVTTDENGMMNGSVNIQRAYFNADSIYYRIKIANKYYVDTDFKMMGVSVNRKDSAVEFGTYIAKTYAFRLKLNVQKKFPSYTITGRDKGIDVALSSTTMNQQKNDISTLLTQSYSVNDSVPVAGIPVVVYRENKQEQIPDFEGDLKEISSTSNSNGKIITVVAVGTTQIENQKSFVVFDRLLSTDFQNEEYKILAVKNLEELINNQHQKMEVKKAGVTGSNSFSQQNYGLIENVINNLTSDDGNYTTNFVDSSKFIAEVMPFKLALPSANSGDDKYYRTVEAKYDVISCKPPTSIFKGRLSYVWPSKKNIKRPLANTHFRVIVDYVDENNKHVGKKCVFVPIGGGGGYWSYSSFTPNGADEGFALIDQDATMAEGTTDGDGNFVIETVNFNYKGSLGSGTLTTTSGGSKPPVVGEDLEGKLKGQISGEEVINPWDQNNWSPFGSSSQNSFGGSYGNANSQGSINSSFDVTLDGGTGAFELKKVNFGSMKGAVGTQGAFFLQRFEQDFSHGPNPSEGDVNFSADNGNDKTQSSTYKNFSRVFRIVIDGNASDYYYPSKDVIVIQPFENCATPKEITHFVREFELKTYTKELNSKNQPIALSGMQVTLFRDPQDKPNNLPQGEGDGKYQYKELINPEYKTNTGASSNSSEVKTNNIFDKKFEQLWSAVPTGEPGSFTSMMGLLQKLQSDYYIEASSFVDKTSKTYQATISDIPYKEFDISDIDWTNPSPITIETSVVLKPLVSRALITVRDVVSGKTLTSDYGTRAIYSKKETSPQWYSLTNDYPSVPVDKYGKAEILATQNPLFGWLVNDPNPTNIYFYSSANGYKISNDQYKASFVKKGYQAIFDMGLSPAGRIYGKITAYHQSSSPNIPSYVLGEPSYLQVDSGKIFETNGDGTFDIHVPILQNSKLKIIPKDVGYFDSTYVMTFNDSKLSELDLKNIQLSRRNHRIQFVVTQKNSPDFVGPVMPISGATIQLGNMVKTTQSNGTAKFEFENVSVNNYTFIIKGTQGSNYIPKTIDVHSEETKDYIICRVELEKGSEVSGIVKLDDSPVKNARVYIDVSSTDSQNYYFNPVQTYNNQSNSSIKNVNIANTNPNLSVNTNLNVSNQSISPTGEITDDANLVVAYTDKFGKYTLHGVPVNNQKINIRATLDTTFTVSGDIQVADIKNNTATTNLNLVSFSQAVINKIYGFPLTVEKITPVSGNSNQVKVTGLVHWTEAISDFKLKEATKSVRIEETIFDLVNINGNNVGVANGNEVNLTGINSLKLSYLDKYNVQLINADGGTYFNSKPLKLIKNNGFGKISGKIKIVDNSFNYPSSYLSFNNSEFYLSKIENGIVNNVLDVETSAFSETDANIQMYNNLNTYSRAVVNMSNAYNPNKATYYLCDNNAKPIKFKLIRFNAEANPQKSFIDKTGKIHLNADLKCHIDNSQPEDFELNIPEMVLDENKVNPAYGSTPIKLKLEDWILEVKDWSFSVEEGGIVSNNSLIRTNIVDIPVKKFVLRKDMFLMDEFQMNNLTLANGKFTLTGVDPSKASLNYEYKIGEYMKPHWNFCLLSNGTDKVASLASLEGLYYPNSTQKYPIDFNYIQILSNNEMLVQLKQNNQKSQLIGNKLANFEPLSIYNGPNYISVNGLLNVGAPRMSDISLTANWTSPTKNPYFETVSTDFEGKGFVHFAADKNNIAITDNLISIQGKVIEKPTKTFNAIPSTFYARTNSTPTYEVIMQKDWVTQLTQDEPEGTNSSVSANNGGYKLKIDKGGMKVLNNDWSTCTFSGMMQRNANSAKSDESDNINDALSSFEVLGDITANSDNVTMSGINTPFGSFKQVFDFANKQLIGTLKIDKEIVIGTFKMHSGTLETCIGFPGFYVAGGCYAFIPAGIFAGDYNIGIMAGTYPLNTTQGENLWNVTNSYIDPSVQNKCYKDSTKRLSGFYTAFNREILNKSISKDYILAAGYIKALALLGGDMYVNVLNNDWKIGLDGYVHVDVSAGISAITGTSISGGNSGDGKVAFQAGTQSYFQANILLDFEATITQSLVFTTISKSISVGCSATGGTSGFDFSIGSSGTKLNCP